MTDYSNILPTDAKNAQLLLSNTDGGSGHTPYNRVLLLIEEDGTVSLESRTYYGGDGTPMREWNGRDLTYTVCPNANADVLRDNLRDGAPLSRLIDQIIDGHSVEWNGNNYVGRVTDEAEGAELDLIGALENLPTYTGQVATAEGWLTQYQQCLSSVVHPSDTAEDLLAAAEADNWLITDGLAGFVAAVAAAAKERAEEDA